MRGEKTEGDNEGGVSEEGGTSREIERRDITLRDKKKKGGGGGWSGRRKKGGVGNEWMLESKEFPVELSAAFPTTVEEEEEPFYSLTHSHQFCQEICHEAEPCKHANRLFWFMNTNGRVHSHSLSYQPPTQLYSSSLGECKTLPDAAPCWEISRGVRTIL